MLKEWSDWWRRLYAYQVTKNRVGEETVFSEEEVLRLSAAELKEAQDFFAQVEDPDLVDYAVYRMKAAEKRYDYLYKKVKQLSKMVNG